MFQGVLFERVKGNRDPNSTPQSTGTAADDEESEGDMEYGEFRSKKKTRKQKKDSSAATTTAAAAPAGFVRMVPLEREIASIISTHHAAAHPSIATAWTELRRKYRIEGLGKLVREARAECEVCRTKSDGAGARQKTRKERD